MNENADAISKTTQSSAKGTGPVQRVGIIGAGIAGLVTAKIFLENGFDVLVFEKEPDLGGVWALSRAYPGLRANTAKETYSLTDYPYPASTSGYPVAEEVRAHLESYADHFGLHPHIKFNNEVVRLAEINGNGKQGFTLTVRSMSDDNKEYNHEFAFVLICSGAFSTPLMPDIPGKEAFRGLVRHSSEWTHPAVADVRRVAVIGGGKSALDCAAWAAREGKTSTLVFRKPHWMVPRYLPGGARSDLRFISRFIEMFINYPVRSWDEKLLHGPGKPFVWLWWAFMSAVVPRVLGMPRHMVPEHKLPVGFESVGQVDDFFDLLNVGRISAIRAGVKGFYEAGIELDDGTQIEADLVIMGTGWQRDMSFLSEELRAQVYKNGRFNLFRRILPPGQQRLAFIGFFPTLTCPLSSEVGAHWAAQYFSGNMTLPSIEEMDRDIDRLENWAKERVPEAKDGVFTGPYIAHYVDHLMRDMGLPTRRTGNFLHEYLGTFLPSRYGTLGQEIKAAREGTRKRRPYLGSLHVLAAIIAIVVIALAAG